MPPGNRGLFFFMVAPLIGAKPDLIKSDKSPGRLTRSHPPMGGSITLSPPGRKEGFENSARDSHFDKTLSF